MNERCSGLYREVARWCGMDAARALYAHYAGAAIKLPKRLTPEHPLAIRLGYEVAQRICAHFGYDQLEVPVRWLSGRELEAEVRERVARGDKINDIARELKVPRPSIHRILKKDRSNEPTLFEM